MNCPNCGKPYDETVSICRYCKTPLGNAHFVPVPKEPSRKGTKLLLFFLVLFILFGAGYCAYQYYLIQVEKQCRNVTEQIMDCCQTLDFTPFESKLKKEQLPEPFQDSLVLVDEFKNYVDLALEENEMNELISLLGIEVDYDGIQDLLMKNASYSIDHIDTTYNRCEVTITTKNIDYPTSIGNLKGEMNTLVSEAAKEVAQSWWYSLKEWFSDFFLSEEDENGDSETEDTQHHKGNLPDTLSGWMDRLITEPEETSYTGKIVYGIKDKKWTLLSVDDGIFYNFYGFPK